MLISSIFSFRTLAVTALTRSSTVAMNYSPVLYLDLL
jgi:hypothetical protein